MEKSDATMEHLSDPKVGDRFTEMYAYWVHIVDVFPEGIVMEEYSPPCNIPDDAKRSIISKEKFLERFCYNSTHQKSWIMFVDNDPSYAEHWSREKTGELAIKITLKVQGAYEQKKSRAKVANDPLRIEPNL